MVPGAWHIQKMWNAWWELCTVSYTSSSASVLERGSQLPLGIEWKSDKGVLFVHVEGEEATQNCSWYNQSEIDVVVQCLRKLVNANGRAILRNIGVLSPYHDQKDQLQTACARRRVHPDLISSVDAMQGINC